MSDTPDTPQIPGRRGPSARKLDPRSVARFLKLLRQGYGVTLALHKLGISRRCLRNSVAEHPRLKRQMTDAVGAARQSLELKAFRMAKKGDARFLEVQLGRIDKARQLARAAREHREKLAILDETLEKRANEIGLLQIASVLSAVLDLIPTENRAVLDDRLKAYQRDCLRQETLARGEPLPAEAEPTPGDLFWEAFKRRHGKP